MIKTNVHKRTTEMADASNLMPARILQNFRTTAIVIIRGLSQKGLQSMPQIVLQF